MRLSRLRRREVRSDEDPPSPADRRRHARLSQDLEVRLLGGGAQPLGSGGSQNGPGVRLVDLSGCGVAVETPVRWSVGDLIGFSMELPEGKPVRASARVRWARDGFGGFAYGLELVGLGLWQRERLLTYLHPQRVGLAYWADLVLQFASAIVLALALGDALRDDRALHAFLGVLPYAAFLLCGAAGLFVTFKRY